MALDIELEIKQGLEEKKNTKTIVKAILSKIKPDTSLPQKEKLINFCLNCGHYKMAFEIFQIWLKKKETPPLAQLIELLNLQIKKPKKELLNLLLEAAKTENLEFEMTRSWAWDALDPRIHQMRAESLKKYKTQIKNRKEILKEKLIFFKNQNMIKEEKKILKELYNTFPEDPDITQYIEEFSERWSTDYLNQFSNQKISKIPFLTQKKKPEDTDLFNLIKNHAFKKAKKNPKLAYPLSLLFYFMEKHTEAYEILTHTPSNYEIDFYSVQILIKSSRYFEALDLIEKIKLKYKSNTEMPFLATYLKAHALKGIGHVTEAISLLEKIVNLKPNFLSTSYLIEEWSLI